MSRWVGLLTLLLTASGIRAGEVAEALPSAGPAHHAVLITVDTLRADTLGFAGNAQVDTPTLDRLAAGGRVFSSAHAHSVTTLPSHASILSGLYPHQHGVRHNGGFVLSADVPTLGSMLQAAGFATAAFVGAFPLDSRFGLDQGFEIYDDDYGAEDSLFLYSERTGDEVVERATDWWRRNPDRRKFLWLHLYDPHAPYSPPEPFKTRFASQPYLGEISAVDAFLAPLLRGFLDGGEEPTLIVFTSDHGEAFGEHGEQTHGLFAYEPTLKVPLVLWGSGVEPGVDRRAARHVDLLPTILEALGEKVTLPLPGRSLLQSPDQHPDISFFEALSANIDYGWAPLRGVLKGTRKLIVLPIPELYDLHQDPRELSNLYQAQQGAARQLARLLPEETSWPPAAGELSADAAARLRSLGYLSGPAAKKERYTQEDDLKNLIGLDRKIRRMADLAAAGQNREAITLGREILDQRPATGLVYIYLSNVLIEEGDPQAAITVMRKARELGVAGHELLRQLGLTLVDTGRPREALEVLEPLVEGGGDMEAKNHQALALAYLGRFEEAEKILGQLARDAPQEARTHENLSFLALKRERYSEARSHAEKALEIDPSRASAWNNLAIARYHLGSAQAAIEAWQRALALSPGDLDALLNLGLVAAQTGEREIARDALRRFLDLAPADDEARRRQAWETLDGLGLARD